MRMETEKQIIDMISGFLFGLGIGMVIGVYWL